MPKAGGSGEDRAKVKLRVIEFELEGGNTSVENSIRQLTHAIVINNSNGAGPKPLVPKTSPALPAAANEDEHTETVDAEFTDRDDGDISTLKASRTPRKAPAIPDPIEVDLTTGEMPFKQFCDERGINSSSTDSKKYLVAAVWMKEYRDTSAIEAGHIYSIFKMMKWNLPADIGAPLRAMKKQKWFTTPERGKFAINHLGENEVNSLTES